MSAKTCRSSPSEPARAVASHSPAMLIDMARLLHILAACPAPLPPQCTTFPAIGPKSGSAAASASSSPPTMKVSSPDTACAIEHRIWWARQHLMRGRDLPSGQGRQLLQRHTGGSGGKEIAEGKGRRPQLRVQLSPS